MTVRSLATRIAAFVAVVALVGFGMYRLASAERVESESWNRLRTFPRERRLALHDSLAEFDRLDSAEQARISELDARLAQLAPSERSHYLSVLRRYHLWLRSLPEDQRRSILETPPSERMTQILKLRQTGSTAQDRRINLLEIDPTDTLGGSTSELAERIRTYLLLTPAEQSDLNRMMPVVRRFERLDRIALERGLPVIALDRSNLDSLDRRFDALSFARNAAARKFALKDIPRARERLLEASLTARLTAPRVDAARLSRFEAALPGWLRSSLDPLPADEARRRLAILYRLVFPEGQEMPEPAKPKPAARPAPSGAPTPSSDQPATPF